LNKSRNKSEWSLHQIKEKRVIPILKIIATQIPKHCGAAVAARDSKQQAKKCTNIM
jgi:hypothetical protein